MDLFANFRPVEYSKGSKKFRKVRDVFKKVLKMIYMHFGGALRYITLKKAKFQFFNDFGSHFRWFFAPQIKFMADFRPVEYSDGSENFFSKSMTSQLSNAVFEIFVRRLDKKTPPLFEKKCKKDRNSQVLTCASLNVWSVGIKKYWVLF